jgi:hypothetical protein
LEEIRPGKGGGSVTVGITERECVVILVGGFGEVEGARGGIGGVVCGNEGEHVFSLRFTS